jgi:hypothetical protein
MPDKHLINQAVENQIQYVQVNSQCEYHDDYHCRCGAHFSPSGATHHLHFMMNASEKPQLANPIL